METKIAARNLITDVAGLRVGNAQDMRLRSGVTVLVGDTPFTAGVHVMGGAPGTRETDLLSPDRVVEQVDALVLSGGSAFGLDAASGVADGLRDMGRGFPVGDVRVPIVPGAILFDLLNGGDKAWRENPYKALGHAALNAASAEFEIGGRGVARAYPDPLLAPTKLAQHGNTTIGIVATDATLTQAQCTRLATAAQDGFARALVPSHTVMDGDLIFAAATGARPAPDLVAQVMLGHAAACVMARAIARAVFAARSTPGDTLPAWQDRFG